jgi:hypothetical protein
MRPAIPLVALVLLCLASLAWLAHPWYDVTAPGTADASVYLLCARSLAAGQGYSYLGMPFNVRPPGFSAILAPLVAARGFDFHAINLLVGAFGVALVALLFVVARPRVGTLLAFVLAIVVWISPAMRAMSNQAMSDVPGAALLFACLAIEMRTRSATSRRGDLVLGLAIATAAYVRSVNLLVAPAVLASRWLAGDTRETRSRAWRGAPAVLGVPLLLLVPWFVRDARSHPPWPADQTAAATYSTAFFHMDWGDPSSPQVPIGEYVARAPEQMAEALAAIGRRLVPGEFRAIDAWLGALALAALVAAAIRKRGAAEIFALLVLLELAVHPAFDERLVLPIALVALIAIVEVARDLLRRALPVAIAHGVVAALLVALLAHDFDPRPSWSRIEADFRARRELADAWKASLPPSARLASNIGWHWSVFLERPVYSLFFAARRARDPAGAEPLLAKYGIDAVILRVDPPEDPVFLDYFARTHGPPMIVGTDGAKGAIFRVRR